MSIQIEIPEALFERIKKHAIPFVDLTPIAVIERWADHFESEGTHVDSETKSGRNPQEDVDEKFSPFSPPDFMHTRCRGTFASIPFKKWNDLLRIAHVKAFSKAGSFDSLKNITHAQIRRGDHSGDSGYHYVKEIDISIQGVDANHAWLYTMQLAKFLKSPLCVTVEWRHNEKAAFPGKTGSIEWSP